MKKLKNLYIRSGIGSKFHKNGGVFDKGYLPNWSVQIYKIHSVKNGNPPLYQIEDERGKVIKGSFYKELQGTKQKENIYFQIYKYQLSIRN